MNKIPSEDVVKITGFVIATEFSRNGKVMEIAVETEGFQEYIVTPNQRGKELFDYIYCNVTAYGVITGKNAQNNQIIKIDSYKINDRVHLINNGE